jgi:diguanylate cyclase (GGDEF)-like protein
MLKYSLLRHRSFRDKIILIVMLTTGISLVLVSAIFMTNEVFTYRYTIAEELSNLGKFIGENAKTSVVNGDRAAAEEILKSLAHHTGIVSAIIFDKSGEVFADFPDQPQVGLGMLTEGKFLEKNQVHTYDGIFDHGQKVGMVYLRSNLRKLYDRLFVFGRILIVMMLCTFLVALQISKGVHGVIADPILHLTEVSKRISQDKDYSIRAQRQTDDEVGDLTDTLNDMLTTIEMTQKRLRYEAFHDSLTSLPNRSLLHDRLEKLIQYAKRNPKYLFAVIFLDLDRFKVINDSLGHIKGDELLRKFAQRLTRVIREVDTVARPGGDEFVILMSEIKNPKEAILVAERVQQILKDPFNLGVQTVYMTASIGIAFNKKEYKQAADLLRDADNAMYSAKSLGKARYEIFDKRMHIDTMNLLKLETDLRHAIIEKNFILHYQPIYSIKDKKLNSLEALLRWQHPLKGLIHPDEFIPLAEETGLILDIGKIVFDMVCKQIRDWEQKGLKVVKTAINFSTKQFEQKGLVKFLKEKILEAGIAPSRLIIEITENVAIHDLDYCIRLMNEIKGLGIHFSLDDFGTGFSSLSCLNALPVDFLKIDRTLIEHLGRDKNNAAITKSIILMSHDLGFKVVAEGVETEEQFAMLNKYGCDEAQGFLLSKPLSAGEIENVL